METMTIHMLREIPGTTDGEQTHMDAIITVGKGSALRLIDRGFAEAVGEKAKEQPEAAPEEEPAEIDRSGIMTAEAAPSDDMAEHTEKPAPRRGPGRPRREQE